MDFKERVRRRNEFDASVVYGTKKFNLLTKRQEHISYREEHDNQWTNPETGIIYDKYAEHIKCPLCGRDEPIQLFIKYGFPHVKCNHCEFVYVNPILKQEEYAKLSTMEDSWESVLETDEQIKMQSLEAKYSLDILELYLQKNEQRSICDVGCGPGTLLIEAKKRGYDTFGVEPNKRCHKFLEENNIDYYGGFFPIKEGIKKKFDCIFLLNTLEHIRNPLGIILESRKLLKPAGIIFISVPHIGALVSRMLHEKSGAFAGHTHVQFFSIKTLSFLLEKGRFEVLEYETIITEIGIIKNYLSFKDPYFGDQDEPLGFLTPEIMYKYHMARNLNMLGRIKTE